jgi:hypothetical protein
MAVATFHREVPMRRLSLALVLAACFALAAPAGACPDNCFFTPGGTWTCTTEASADTVFDSTAYPSCFRSIVFAGYTAGYSIPQGTLYASVGGGFDGACGPGIAVTDDFVIGGLPAGTQVTLRAQLALRFQIGCILPGGSHGIARLESGAQSAMLDIELDNFADQVPRDTTVVLTLSVVAGTPFRLLASTQVRTGECLARMDGTLMFLDLPSVASVTSCNGFVQAPTPARATTWGAIKAGYR